MYNVHINAIGNAINITNGLTGLSGQGGFINRYL